MDPTKRRSRILTVVLICLVACALLLCVLHPSAEHLYVLEVQGDSLYAGSDPDGLPSYSISRADLYLRNRFLLPVKVSSLKPGGLHHRHLQRARPCDRPLSIFRDLLHFCRLTCMSRPPAPAGRTGRFAF